MLALVMVAGCDDEVVGYAAASGSTSTSAGPTSSNGTSTGGPDATATADGSESSESSSTGSPFEDEPPDFIAFGREQGFVISYDQGESWVEVPEPTGVAEREDAVRGEERIVVVGGAQSMVSLDGVQWTGANVDGIGWARAVAYGSGGFAAVGLEHIAWSTDGETWADARGGSTKIDFFDVTYGDGRFVAVGIGQIATSENGENWAVNTVGGDKLYSVTYGNGRFVALGENGRILETANGVDVLRDENSGLVGQGDIRFCEGEFVTGGPDVVWVSPDASDWTEIAMPNQGLFDCSASSYVVVKDEGLFHTPTPGPVSQVYGSSVVLDRVHFVGP